MVRRNESFITGKNSTKYWFSVNTSNKFTALTTNFDVEKRKWANISLFNGEDYVLMFRGNIFVKQVDRFRWFKKYKNIINIPSTKTWFSGLVYKYKWGGCNATYYGKTKRHSETRICEHLGISHLTGKKIKIDNNKLTVIQEHLLCCNYSPSFEDLSILTRESNDFKLKIMESLLIAHDKPHDKLNKADSSLPLELS